MNGLRHPARAALLLAALLARPADGAADDAADVDASLRTMAQQLHQLEAEFKLAPIEFYVAQAAPQLLLRELRLQLDGVEIARHRYSDAESRALLASGGLQRFAVLRPPAPGQRLRALASARRADAAPNDAPLRFDSPLPPSGAAAVELVLVAGGVMQAPALAWRALGDGADARVAAYMTALRPLPQHAETIAQYNAALQAPAAGAAGNAFAALDRLGKAAAEDAAAWMLRDRANLTLGELLLRQGDGASAAEALRRVRSPGAFENRALLALGWAMLVQGAAPAPAPATPALPGAPRPAHVLRLAALPRLPDQRVTVAQQARGDALTRALVPWLELVGRDALDPAVQEGHLAVAYALDQLAAHEQAQHYYERAVALLQGARETLARGLEDVAQSGFPGDTHDADDGWQWWLSPRTHASDSGSLRSLMQSSAFLSAFAPYRALRHRQEDLAASAARVAALPAQDARVAALQARIEALDAGLARELEARRQELRTVATQHLAELDAQAGRYLVLAHLALARRFDRPPLLARAAKGAE